MEIIYPRGTIVFIKMKFCIIGISQSAIREMSLCRELNNKNITKLVDIILENKSIYMVLSFVNMIYYKLFIINCILILNQFHVLPSNH